MTQTLDERAEILLKTLIEQYIEDGQPVGSRLLARSSGLKLSPATIRNVMSDLEELGLIRSPHTSAGRVPTQSGYRVFVDSLLRVKPVRDSISERFVSQLTHESDIDHLVQSASTMLSELTRFAGVVMVPNTEHALFRHIEFLPLGGKRLLVILVSKDGRVQNRVITTDREYSPAELVEAANYFNEAFADMPLDKVRMQLLRGMEEDTAGMNRAIQDAIHMARMVFEDQDEKAAA